MTKAASTHYLSRSALAEKLAVSLKELTQLLIESGWLIHNDNAEKGKEWKLSAKGEFEGGIYRESKKFGTYIVWPESVIAHPAITGIKDSLVSATSIGKYYTLSAKMINRLLAEMGWLSHYAKGWKVTELGALNGGVQASNKATGVPYVSWQRSLLTQPSFEKQVKSYQGLELESALIDGKSHFLSLDGRYIASIAEVVIANYLYIAGLAYAYRRTITLSIDDFILSDFYLPKVNVHIHFQVVDIPPSELSQQLARQISSKKYHLNIIELSLADTSHLDQVLAKALLELGVSEE
ncbi:MAG: hypothetical protein ACI9D5_001331 [Candidatus Endobugula sp.]|jgi:hypothetical protein